MSFRNPEKRTVSVLKIFVFLACLLPLTRLLLETFGVAGFSLGANPVEELLHRCGIWGLNFLLITLAVTPVRRLLKLNWLLRFRRMFGLFAFFYVCLHFTVYAALDQRFNLAAIAELNRRHKDLDIVFIESGGDNLAATFSPELADLTLYVISVCQGDDIPRKGGPAITRSDLLIINKSDLAPYVGANLDRMDADAKRMRGNLPYVFTDLLRHDGESEVVDFIIRRGGLARAA